jgi:hypothetical protein
MKPAPPSQVVHADAADKTAPKQPLPGRATSQARFAQRGGGVVMAPMVRRRARREAAGGLDGLG